jgi:hypothetical protein
MGRPSGGHDCWKTQIVSATRNRYCAERLPSLRQASAGDPPPVATGLNNLAQVLQEMNRLDEAEPLMRRAFAIDAANFGKDHPSVARDMSNLALALFRDAGLDQP